MTSTLVHEGMSIKVIRLYIRDEEADPEIIGLYNATTGKDLDLSDDVHDCASPGDRIEAREYTIQSTKETQQTPSEMPGPDHLGAAGGGDTLYGHVPATLAGGALRRRWPKSIMKRIGGIRSLVWRRGGTEREASVADGGRDDVGTGVCSGSGADGRTLGEEDDCDEYGLPTRPLLSSPLLPVRGFCQRMVPSSGAGDRVASHHGHVQEISFAPLMDELTAICGRVLSLRGVAVSAHAAGARMARAAAVRSRRGREEVKIVKLERGTGLAAAAVVHAPAETVFHCLMDTAHRPAWDASCAAAHVMSANRHVDEIQVELHSAPITVRVAGSCDVTLPFVRWAPRAARVLRFWQRSDDGSFAVALRSAAIGPDSDAPAGCTWSECTGGGWLVVPLDAGRGAQEAVVVRESGASHGRKPPRPRGSLTGHTGGAPAAAACIIVHVSCVRLGGWVGDMGPVGTTPLLDSATPAQLRLVEAVEGLAAFAETAPVTLAASSREQLQALRERHRTSLGPRGGHPGRK